jgi:rhodanese-related sulfurtransferase
MANASEVTTALAPERVAELLEQGEADVIDVRDDEEWDAGHIAGARHVELADLTAAAEGIDRERTVVFNCRTGDRSGMAADAFREAGYDAYNMDGGIVAWADAGLPLEPADGEVVDRRPPEVHEG